MRFTPYLRITSRRPLFGRALFGVALVVLLSFGSAAAQDTPAPPPSDLLAALIARGDVSPDALQSPFTASLCFLSTVTSRQGLVLEPSGYPPPTTPAPNSSSVSVSADGRYIAFQSDADNLVTSASVGGADTNKATDVFRYDRLTCTIERVSLTNQEGQAYYSDASCNNATEPIVHCIGGGWSRRPSISADGRYISFTSQANNLDTSPPDTNTWRDIFVRDMVNGTTERVSLSTGGFQGAQSNDGSTISADGRYVAFYSASALLLATQISPTLITTDTNNFCQRDTDPDLENCYDVFVRDTQTNTTERVSVGNEEQEGNNDAGQTVVNIQTIVPVDHIGLSADGRYVAFYSKASNLVANDTNGVEDVFVRDRVNGTTTRISVSSAGVQANGSSFYPDMSSDGRYIVFESNASNFITDLNNVKDIYLRDTLVGTTTIVSLTTYGAQVGAPGNPPNEHSQPSISADGRYVAFMSGSSNLQMPVDISQSTDNNSATDVYVRDLVLSRTRIISSKFDGTQGNGGSGVPEISDNGQFVAFESDASTLVNGDINAARDAFVTEWQNVSFEPETNMIFNRTFTETTPSAGDALRVWNVFGLPENPIVTVENGVVSMYRQTNSLQGVIFQNTFHYLWTNSPIEAQVQAGNNSSVRKRFVILAHDGDFSDLQVCSFWIPPNTPLRTYTLRSKTNENWTNVSLSIYSSSPDGTPALQIDNVSMTYRPSLNQLQTRSECIDPGAPLPTVGDTSANLLANGTFSGSTFAPWAVFDDPAPGAAIIANLNSGVMNLYRQDPVNAGAFLQNTPTTTITAGTPLELRARIGNSSNLRKRLTVLIHHQNFQDLQVCTFWLQPNTLMDTYVIRTHTTQDWNLGTSVSFYVSTADNTPAIQLDDVELRAVPSLSVGGTSCYLPGAGVLTEGRDADLALELRPTLLPTATPQAYVAPGLSSEMALQATATPEIPTGNEGSVTETFLLPTATPTPSETPTEVPTEMPTEVTPDVPPTDVPTIESITDVPIEVTPETPSDPPLEGQ